MDRGTKAIAAITLLVAAAIFGIGWYQVSQINRQQACWGLGKKYESGRMAGIPVTAGNALDCMVSGYFTKRQSDIAMNDGY